MLIKKKKNGPWMLRYLCFMGIVPTRPRFAEEVFNNQSPQPVLTHWQSGTLAQQHGIDHSKTDPAMHHYQVPSIWHYNMGEPICPLVEVDCIGPPSPWVWQLFFLIGVDINLQMNFPSLAAMSLLGARSINCPSTLLQTKKCISKRKRNLCHSIKKSNTMG